MPIAYSTKAGSKEPDKALWASDYVLLLNGGLLSDTDISYGFKAYLSKDLLDIGPDQYIHLLRKYLPQDYPRDILRKAGCDGPLLDPLNLKTFQYLRDFAVIAARYKQRLERSKFDMSQPTLQINGEEPAPVDTGSNDSGSIASTRKSLHQNIIGKLRPLPFQYHWTIWYDKHTDSSNYDNRLYVLYEDVADIATFYRVYNNYPWDKIRLRDTVHIFRKGVKPVWEDPENLKGGCWTFRVPKAKAQAFFHEIAILCMANEFQAALEKGRFSQLARLLRLMSSIYAVLLTDKLAEHDHVLGVSTSIRFNSHLISVWNKLGSNQRAIKALEETIIDRLSPELRPAGASSYFYKRHDEHDGYQQAVEASKNQSEKKVESQDEKKDVPASIAA
ncbi:translation initiation factor eIF4E, putative [Paecilomyces variotii No. 5]|uniref:Translation initiation factor eIF4E, putative n=1 Tax=Byssochlamys spectabilis (strain No. 5 / NBRC 109023) TaxID=1356009 RepID=V5G2H6_BYSSN|nr:translation initiation factor eIF4E, putative [Paecilomyces variotii No. 5]